MNILAINISHNESISRLVDSKLIDYIENLSENFYFKIFPKKNNIDFYISPKILNEKPDIVIYSSYDRRTNFHNEDKMIIDVIQKQIGNPKFLFFPEQHHLYHAFNSFKLSSFKECLSIVLDGGGSQKVPGFREIESIYYFSENNYRCFYQTLTSRANDLSTNIPVSTSPGTHFELSDKTSSGQKFSLLCQELFTDEVKERFFNSENLNLQDQNMIIYKYLEIMMILNNWGNERGNKIEDRIKKLHIETKNDTIKFIEKALNYQYSNNIVLSGGFLANPFNREEYIKYFSNHNLFFDPVPHDGGTSSGAAFWLDHMINILNYSYEDLKKLPNCYTNI